MKEKIIEGENTLEIEWGGGQLKIEKNKNGAKEQVKGNRMGMY